MLRVILGVKSVLSGSRLGPPPSDALPSWHSEEVGRGDDADDDADNGGGTPLRRDGFGKRRSYTSKERGIGLGAVGAEGGGGSARRGGGGGLSNSSCSRDAKEGKEDDDSGESDDEPAARKGHASGGGRHRASSHGLLATLKGSFLERSSAAPDGGADGGGGGSGPKRPPCHIVAELRDLDNEPIIKVTGGDSVELIVVHDLIGRILANSARRPNEGRLFDELLGRVSLTYAFSTAAEDRTVTRFRSGEGEGRHHHPL